MPDLTMPADPSATQPPPPAGASPQAPQRRQKLLVATLRLAEKWWARVTRKAHRAPQDLEPVVAFSVRQWVDLMSTSAFQPLRPETIWVNRLADDAARDDSTTPEAPASPNGSGPPDPSIAATGVGEHLATTPGTVIFRNDLIELIQYAPTTPLVAARPVLIVPPWIAMDAVLDLSPKHSLVRWLIARNHSLFMISWRKPDTPMFSASLDDYRTRGVMAAIAATQAICGDTGIHAMGYCLGGTLLTIAAAAMATDNDHRLASLSLFVAQTDFTHAGDLQLFITDQQLRRVSDRMQTQGHLVGARLGGALEVLRSDKLIWYHSQRDSLLDRHGAWSEPMPWQAGGTRLPANMHAEFLRRLYLHNDLAEGRLRVVDRTVAINHIRVPMFIVAAEQDHIAPWRSVFRTQALTDGEITFVLSSGGHDVGTAPRSARQHFRIAMRDAARPLTAAKWQRKIPSHEGSWWPEWDKWLHDRSGQLVDPPKIGMPGSAPLYGIPAPYLRQP